MGPTTSTFFWQPAACPFKVIRYASVATLQIRKTGDQGIRILYFENESGNWSTDLATKVAVTKHADIWVLIIDEETYEVPDSVLIGG